MGKEILRKFETEIYPFKLWVAIAEDRENILEKFVSYTESETIKDVPCTDVVYYVEEIETKNYGALIVFYDKSRITHKTVTHEAIHAISMLMECIGDKVTGSESCAYLAGWIADCCEKTKCEI